MTKKQKFTICLPIVYSCFLSLIIFFQVNLFPSELTTEARELLVQTPVQFLSSLLLLLIPNFIVSFFLLTYTRAHPSEENNTLILCLSSLTIATLMSCSIWIFFYTAFSRVPVIVFGFPVTYFFGALIGYIIGIFFIGMKRQGSD